MIATLIGMSIITLYVALTFLYKKKDQPLIYRILFSVFVVFLIETIGIFLQIIIGDKLGIPLVYYEYIVYFGKAFAPTLILLFAIVYENPRIELKKLVWIFFIPVFIVIAVWTNDFHHMFFVEYTSVLTASKFGLLYYAYAALVYLQYIPAIIIIIRSAMDKNGLVSPQTMLMIFTCIIPLIPRLVSLIVHIPMPLYLQPIAYMFMTLTLSLNIIKYNVLKAIPVALKSVIDIMSDAFVVVGHDGAMLDMNRSFMSKFNYPMNLKVNKNIFDAVRFEGIKDMKKLKNQIIEAHETGKTLVEEYHIVKEDYDKYFEVQIQPIRARLTKDYIATLLVFRDITEQKANIDVIVKRENLSVIGELAGGVAHDINTPITAIKSGLLMLKTTVPTEQERALIETMSNSADKISNLVNSLKNQIRNLGSSSDSEFSLTELVQDLYVIMHTEFAKHNIRLQINTTQDIWLSGNTAKLAQVFTNILHNSMEAYGDKGGIIDIDIYKDEAENAIIMIEDWAGGIPENIQPYIFKKIIKINDMPTTGVGLYLAYSVIRGSFGGDIKFDTKQGRGTRFYITIPIK